MWLEPWVCSAAGAPQSAVGRRRIVIRATLVKATDQADEGGGAEAAAVLLVARGRSR